MVQPHIHLSEELGVKYAILPGDPGRVTHIKEFLDNAEEVTFNREYRSAVGTYKGVKVLALSTGMGGVSVGIALEELHNIGVEAVIRIGSAGALQEGIRIGDLILCEGAVREDGTSKTYVKTAYPAVADAEFLVRAAVALVIVNGGGYEAVALYFDVVAVKGLGDEQGIVCAPGGGVQAGGIDFLQDGQRTVRVIQHQRVSAFECAVRFLVEGARKQKDR